jgi:methylmalonyl-CoA epimerase
VLLRLHHVGLIVRDLEATSAQYTEKLGLRLDRVEDYGDGLLRIGFLVCGDVFLELIQPLTDEGPNAAWLRSVGEGIQHLAFEVGDVNGTLAELTARGVPLLDRGARRGASGTRIAFLDPRGFAGSLLELVEETAESRAVNAHALDAGWVRYCGAAPPGPPPRSPNPGGSEGWPPRPPILGGVDVAGVHSAPVSAIRAALTSALSQGERGQTALRGGTARSFAPMPQRVETALQRSPQDWGVRGAR